MLKRTRIALAGLFFIAITLLFLDITGALHAWLGWLAKIQFLPAILALNAAVIAVLVLLTLVFGRVYCSVICPLGVFQDIVSRISVNAKRRRKDNRPYSYSPEKKLLRYLVWGLFGFALIGGVHVFVSVLAPYSSYGRIVTNLFAPVYGWFNNIFASVSERAGSYAFYSKEVWLKSLPTFIVAAATFVFIIVLAWRGGRTYCNTLCPVGTTLSFFSRFALFRPVIDAGKCKNCRVCEHNCKASCIDIDNHNIDYSRCVDCFNCVEDCKFGALHYKFAYGSKDSAAKEAGNGTDKGRRAFIATTAMVTAAATVKAQEKKVDGGFATVLDKEAPGRSVPITPFGSKGNDRFYQHCTACQLCVSECPNNVLRPSSDLDRFMQPEMSYEKGWCRPECVRCSEVCPTSAIRRITKEEKTVTSIGTAQVDRSLCVVETKDVNCGNCARHCPSGAIMMVPKDPSDPDSKKIPAVMENLCIGCGACENLCPSRPLSAIRVNGKKVHTVKE